jgi:hypothetical protein
MKMPNRIGSGQVRLNCNSQIGLSLISTFLGGCVEVPRKLARNLSRMMPFLLPLTSLL